MTIDYEKMTDEIMQGMTKASVEASGIVKEIIKTEIGDTILCRFVLYRPNPKNSIYNYKHHGWKGENDNYISVLCPTTNDPKAKCPICRKSITYWKSNNPFLIDASKKIRRKENWSVNVYIIDDTKHPENNGKVKVFRYGKQIKAIIDEATIGADKDIFGKNIWRLDGKGCNFRIVVKPNSDKKDAWPSYTSSKFLPPSDIGLSDSDVKNIFENAHDLTTIFDREYGYGELEDILQKEYIDNLQKQESDDAPVKTTGQKPAFQNKPKDDDLDYDFQPKKEEKVEKVEPAKSKTVTEDTTDEIDRMIEELG